MIRKFKHIGTGIIGVNNSNTDGWLHYERRGGGIASVESIPMIFVEDSEDWVEFMEPIDENKEVFIEMIESILLQNSSNVNNDPLATIDRTQFLEISEQMYDKLTFKAEQTPKDLKM
jgi:hypothetical protein